MLGACGQLNSEGGTEYLPNLSAASALGPRSLNLRARSTCKIIQSRSLNLQTQAVNFREGQWLAGVPAEHVFPCLSSPLNLVTAVWIGDEGPSYFASLSSHWLHPPPALLTATALTLQAKPAGRGPENPRGWSSARFD